jgi:hypothetical protein
MNTVLIGVILLIIDVILTSIEPILVKDTDTSVFFLVWFIYVLLTIFSYIHLKIFKPHLIKETYDTLVSGHKIKDIFIYGLIRFINTLLFLYALCFVMPGLYCVLKSSSVIIYIFIYWILYKIPIDKIEWCGIIVFTITLVLISYILLNSKSYNFEGKSFYKITTFRKTLAAFLIIIVIFTFGIMDNLYTELSNKTYVDIFISSIGPLLFATITILIKYVITKKFGFPDYKYLLPIFSAFLFIYYIPMILDYGIINYAPKLLILIFFIIQIVVGILIDKYYYKKNISNKELIYISILIISSIVCIYGFHMNTKTHTSIDLSTSTGSKNTIIVTPEAEEEEYIYKNVIHIVKR